MVLAAGRDSRTLKLTEMTRKWAPCFSQIDCSPFFKKAGSSDRRQKVLAVENFAASVVPYRHQGSPAQVWPLGTSRGRAEMGMGAFDRRL